MKRNFLEMGHQREITNSESHRISDIPRFAQNSAKLTSQNLLTWDFAVSQAIWCTTKVLAQWFERNQ